MANTTADKLNGILTSKEAIRQAIIAKGQECPTATTLAQYASKISAISGGTGDYYKCASVDTTNQTWTGYKYENGTLATTTTSLAYTSIVPPTVGYYYSSNGTVKADLYSSDGISLYATLDHPETTTETGQQLITQGTLNYATVDGIPCVFIDGSSIARAGIKVECNLASGTSPFSFSLWAKASPDSTGASSTLFFGNVDSSFRTLELAVDPNNTFMVSNGADWLTSTQSTSIFSHVAYTYDGTTAKLYINGILVNSSVFTFNLGGDYVGIGYRTKNNTYIDGKVYVSSVRCYNRVLTASEIAILANEFTPTVA